MGSDEGGHKVRNFDGSEVKPPSLAFCDCLSCHNFSANPVCVVARPIFQAIVPFF